MGRLRAVDAVPVEGLDLAAELVGDLGDPVPVDGEPVVPPAQRVVLVQVGEEQLAAHAVVVADAVTADREAEHPVEEDRVLDVAALLVALGLQLHRLLEGGEVAAELLQAVHPERAALLDHEGVERQVAVAVGPVVDEVPQDEGLLGAVLVLQEAGRVGGDLQAEQLDGGGGDGAEARGLAVAEDAAPGETFRRLADGHRLREEHRGVGVVAGREVGEGDRHEHRVVEARALQLRQPVGPDDLQQDGLEVAVRVAVLGVHREDDEVLQAVLTLLGRLERQQRVEEVGLAVAGVGPLAQVGEDSREVGGVVREERGELLDRGEDVRDQRVDGVPLHRGQVDGAVLGLQRAEGLDGVLQAQPGLVAGRRGGSIASCGERRRKILHLRLTSTGDVSTMTP
ncbi:hypothetical protein GCM10025734_21580 [Kitasatospora paranensis]